MELNELTAVSPIDGRYKKQINELSDYFSESSFIKYRIMIEIKWLLELNNLNLTPYPFTDEQINKIESIYKDFNLEKCEKVKEIENTTNHDVKAIEYFIREELNNINLNDFCFLVHLGCTSEDINNLAYGLMIKDSMNNIIIPEMNNLINYVKEKAIKYKNIPMLAHTHGQPASPTTVGKELAVFVYRWQNSLEFIKQITNNLKGKFSGAIGCFNAINIAYPNIDWIEASKHFIEKLGLEQNILPTQIENHDTICMLFNAIKNFNNITQDFNSDMWLYISKGYFKQIVVETETGSSVMPHKVNPIRQENSMANIRIANSLFDCFTNNLQISRMQRDLTDSSMLRNIGVSFSHTLLSLKQSLKGFNRMEPNEEILYEDLDNNPEVLAEAIQTILRKNKYDNAYELLKEFTRGKEITLEELQTFINSLNINVDDKKILLNLTPHNYIGLASKLCDLI